MFHLHLTKPTNNLLIHLTPLLPSGSLLSSRMLLKYSPRVKCLGTKNKQHSCQHDTLKWKRSKIISGYNHKIYLRQRPGLDFYKALQFQTWDWVLSPLLGEALPTSSSTTWSKGLVAWMSETFHSNTQCYQTRAESVLFWYNETEEYFFREWAELKNYILNKVASLLLPHFALVQA